ncbi:MAG: hypothetical protein WAN17_12620 [Candidatus Sulfotelmatobacter sp.]
MSSLGIGVPLGQMLLAEDVGVRIPRFILQLPCDKKWDEYDESTSYWNVANEPNIPITVHPGEGVMYV